MISENLIRQSLAAAEQLIAEGNEVVPHTDSLLAELVSLSMPPCLDEHGLIVKTDSTDPTIKTTEVPSEDLFVNDVVNVTREWEDSSNPGHSVKVAAIADSIAPFVNAHIAHARNVVAPLIAELETNIRAFVERAKCVDPGSEFEIIQAQLPALVVDETFSSMYLDNVTNLKPIQIQGPYLTVKSENIDEIIRSAINLGSDRLNSLVSDMLKKGPYDLMRRTYLANYSTFEASNGMNDTKNYYGVDTEQMYYFGPDFMTSNTLRNQNPYHVLYVHLADLLLASWMRQNTQPVFDDVSLEKYNEYFDQRVMAAAVMVKNSLNTIKLQHESGILVTEANPITKKIVVHGSIYRSWLEKGGCPEALLGLLVTNNMVFNANVLLEQKEKGCRAWDSYLLFRSNDLETTLKDATRSYIRSFMAQSLTNLTESEKEYQASCSNLIEQIMKRVDEEIAHFDHRIIDDIAHLALHLVAKARFFYTSAYSILGEMAQVEKSNPDIDPREAATISVISYLAEYMEAMMVLPKKQIKTEWN